MKRRNFFSAVGLFVMGALVAVALYVSNLRAEQPAASKKADASQATIEQIKQLQARIASLEARIATLEQRPSYLLAPTAGPSPPLSDDGFPRPRVLLIDGKTTTANPGR